MAAIILVVAALGAAEVLVGSQRTNFRAEQTQVATERAQAELEEIRALSYGEIALNTTPSSTGPNGPGDRLTASCAGEGVSSDGCFALNRNGTQSAPLVVEGGALEDGSTIPVGDPDRIDPGPTPFTIGDVSGKVYRYIVWRDDAACGEENCPGQQDLKRVVVIVTLDGTAVGGDRSYREIQSDFVDPEAGRNVEPTPVAIQEVIAEPFWLTDRTCDFTGRTATVSRTNHPLHNTLGECSDGEQTGASPGAPDLLLPSPPDNESAGVAGPLYDYATDVEPTINPQNDSGVQFFPPAGGDCVSDVDVFASHEDGHVWLTNPVPAGDSFVLDGSATLSLQTKVLDQVPGAAEVCILLFVRDPAGGTESVDTPIGDAGNFGRPYFTYSQNSWPNGRDEIPIQLPLEPDPGESTVSLGPGQRLGLALSLRPSGSTVNGIQVDYEHPDFDSFLELKTSTPGGFG